MDIPLYANIVSAVSALGAAGLWWRSTIVEVLRDDTPDENGMVSGGIFVEGKTGLVDVVSTQYTATEISRKAALAAALAALAQSIAIGAPLIAKLF